MKNFLVAVGLLILIMFIKNFYEDNHFLKGEIELLNYEIMKKENSINKLQKEKKVLIKQLEFEKHKNKQPKKIKRKFVKPIEVTPEPIIEVAPQKVDTLGNF